MATKTIGSAGGRDYATIAAWASYLNALVLSAPEIGQLFNDSEFSITSTVTIGGYTGDSSTNTVTLTTGTGQSFRDNASVQTNPLTYNQSNGVGVRGNGNYLTMITVTGNNFICSGGQFATPISAAAPQSVFSIFNLDTGIKLANLILYGALRSNSYPMIYTFTNGGIYQNIAIVVTSASGNGITSFAHSAADQCTDVTCVNSSGASTGTAFNHAAYSPNPIVSNCVSYGFGTDFAGTADASSTNNATDKGSFGGTNFGSSGQTSVTSASFQSVTGGSEDLRAKSGGKLIDNGATVGPTNDIAGTVRPQGSAYDIGCWELVVSGGAPIFRRTLSSLGTRVGSRRAA